MTTLLTKKAKTKISQDNADEICKMYEQGVPSHEIVAKFGIHRTTLPKLFKRYKGITRSLIPQIHNPRYFQVIDSHEKAYFVGFIAADGCITTTTTRHSNDRLVINIHEKDRAIVDRLKEVLGMEQQIHYITSKSQVCLSVTSSELCDDLRQYGLDYRKSLTMPNILPLIPEEFKSSFVLGYNDGDGCIYIKKTLYKSTKGYIKTYENPSFEICGTKSFLLGIADYLQLTFVQIILHKSIHVLHINAKSDFHKTYELLYRHSDKTIHLERKKNVIYRLKQDQTISSPGK